MVIEMLSKHPRPYADIIIFIVLPIIVFSGLVLIIAGVVRERRRLKAGGLMESRFPILDFNDPRHRTLVLVFIGGFVLLSLLYAFAGFKTYEYTESDTFCGVVCHSGGQSIHRVENLSYSFSPHAKVGCSTCHVGSGAKYFVLYKLRGMKQLFDVITGRVPKPIPTPVADLRPAQDVCESCHGPKYQFYERLEARKYFLPDAGNTRWDIDLLLRMGTAGLKTDRPPKMHWHSSTTEEIIYDASDPKRVVIPWVHVKRLDGKERTYRSRSTAPGTPEPGDAVKRRMDCVDCHNRAGHPFHHPSDILNALLSSGLVDPALPDIKTTAVKALEGKYRTFAEGKEAIRKTIIDFTGIPFPSVAEEKRLPSTCHCSTSAHV
jgi:nitrate/TMAO reductase-like tetraheme cytochrome c subunit